MYDVVLNPQAVFNKRQKVHLGHSCVSIHIQMIITAAMQTMFLDLWIHS